MPNFTALRTLNGNCNFILFDRQLNIWFSFFFLVPSLLAPSPMAVVFIIFVTSFLSLNPEA